MHGVLALVLAGGSGEELGVLTTERAVSAVPFGGKYRVADFVLSNCCHSGVDRVGVLTQHAPASLHDHIGGGRPWDLDRRSGGVILLQPFTTRSQQGRYRGTADAITQNWRELQSRGFDRVLVLSGDHVYRMDYRPLLQAHVQRAARATIAVARVDPSDTRRFGMATLDGNGRVLSIEEKPARADTPFASMGVYVFDTEVLAAQLARQPRDLVLDVLQPMLDHGDRVQAFEFTGYWEDVGTVPAFYRSNLELLAPQPRLVLHDPRWPVLTRDEERPPVLVRDGASIEASLVANGCRVAGTVRHSVLFPGVVVEAGARIEDSIVMQDVVIGRGARLDRAIVDKHARIGEGAVIGDGPAGDGVADGVTLIGKDARVPDETRLGRDVWIGVGARGDDFGGGVVAAHARVGGRTWYADAP